MARRAAINIGFPSPNYVCELGNREAILAGVYEVEQAAASAALAVPIADLRLAAAGTVIDNAALGKTLADPTLSAAGTLDDNAALAVTIADPALSATGTVIVDGSLAVTIADPALSATGNIIEAPAPSVSGGAPWWWAMATRRRRIVEIVKADQPMTVRQVYYQAVVHGIVGKDEADYDKIQDILTGLRRDKTIPYEWIIDEGRFARQPYTVEGIPEGLNDTRRNYRKDPWHHLHEYVQIWVEKNALVGVLEPVTEEYDVALMASVGYSSISFLHGAAKRLNDLGDPIYIYHLGDLDPSGEQAAETIKKDLRGFAPDAAIHFERIAITPEQIVELNLQAALRPTKAKDPRYNWFLQRHANSAVLDGGRLSCELDAIRATDLRDLVRSVIERHLPRDELDRTNARGAQEKIQIGRILDRYLDDLKDPDPITICQNGGPANGEWISVWSERAESPSTHDYTSFSFDAAETVAIERMIRNDELENLYQDFNRLDG